MIAIVLLWAVAVFAQASDTNSAYGVTPRDQDPADVNALLGINCRGSTLCNIPICSVSLAAIKKYVDTLDDKEEWGNGDQIACNLCPGCTPGNPNCAGICAFPRSLKKDEKVNAGQVKSAINALVKHKCGRCGSCPTKEGNDVRTGQITVNYVESGCKEGVCDYKRKNTLDEVVPGAAPDRTTNVDILIDKTLDVYDPVDTSLAPGTSDNVYTLGAGINCKGSNYCKYCRASLEQIAKTLELMPDELEFKNGEKIACQQCNHEYVQGMCIFARKLHRPISIKDVKVLIKRLRKNSCGRCGSVPLHVGANVDQGMITANYVSQACRGKGLGKPWGCGPR